MPRRPDRSLPAGEQLAADSRDSARPSQRFPTPRPTVEPEAKTISPRRYVDERAVVPVPAASIGQKAPGQAEVNAQAGDILAVRLDLTAFL